MQPFVKIQNTGDPWLASGSQTYHVIMCYDPSVRLTWLKFNPTWLEFNLDLWVTKSSDMYKLLSIFSL